MRSRRWWDAAVIAASLAVAVAMALGTSGATAADLVLAVSGLFVFAVAYAAVARPGWSGERRSWRQPVFTGLAAASFALGCAGEPFFAVLQAVAYPLVWVLTDDRRRAVVGSVVLGLGVFVGFAVFGGVLEGGDAVLPALASAAATAGFGVVFAIAFGLWISGVVDYGEERARLLAELTAAQSEIEALSRERGASMERERLAREVHDTLAQTLAGLTILAERSGRQLSAGRTDAAADSIATVERLARDALAETRAIVSRTAAVPSDTALEDAVDRLVDRFRTEVGLAIDCVTELAPERVVSRDAQLVVLRCLQESLANVRKHAAATRVRVRVATDLRGDVVLEVEDDGRGFEPGARRDGFGLDGMTERVALAGGALDIASRPGGGTTLRVTLPASDRETPAVTP